MKKTVGSTNTWFIYDASGQLAAEYGGTAPPETGTHYLTTDHLGSTRLVTRQTNTVVSRHDYLPFGEEIPVNYGGRTTAMGYQTNPALTQRFTGKERDSETRLDYFGARYYSAGPGRFTSADWSAQPTAVPYADLTNPQSLNLYTYALNNPMSDSDPDGHCAMALPACAWAGIRIGATAGSRTGTPAGALAGGAIGGLVGVSLWLQVQTGITGKSAAQLDREGFAIMNGKLPEVRTEQGDAPKDVYIDPKKYPAAAGHAEDAQKAGQPQVLTVQRPGASGRRDQATAGVSTQPGTDRDEYPPAVTAEGGKGASVKNIPSSDNRGAGASVGAQIRNVPDGGRIRIVPRSKPEDKQ